MKIYSSFENKNLLSISLLVGKQFKIKLIIDHFYVQF